jgi:uncharacterized membrane protein
VSQIPFENSSMNRAILAGALLTLTATGASAQPGRGADKFGWYADYASARAEARRTGKPIFLVFRCEP